MKMPTTIERLLHKYDIHWKINKHLWIQNISKKLPKRKSKCELPKKFSGFSQSFLKSKFYKKRGATFFIKSHVSSALSTLPNIGQNHQVSSNLTSF